MPHQPHLFFDFARHGKRLTVFWLAILVAIGATFSGQIMGGIAFFAGYFANKAVSGEIGGGEVVEKDMMFDMSAFSSVEQGFLLASSFLPIAILIFLWIAVFENRSPISLGFHGLGRGLFKFARGGLFGLLSMAIMAFGMQALGYAEGSTAQPPSSWIVVWPLLILLLGWIIQGSTEEIVARGLLFQSVGARHGLMMAVIVSSALFTLGHGMNSNPSALFFINLALYSVFACFYALREASLWGICGHHAMWNFTQGNLFGFAVSGEQFGADRLMQFTETGPDLITGGATGPEGGLVTTLILGLSMLVLLLIKPSKDLYDKVPARPDPDAEACPIN